MSRLVDIVNFNADASCMSSTEWMGVLKGGGSSRFCRWLSLYVGHGKKMALGMTGATVSDLAKHNPEALAIVRDNPDIFQVILRPYSHDISLLRTSYGFRFNIAAGKTVIMKEIGRVSDYYLPPEFMLMSEQVSALAGMGVKVTFISSGRFTSDMTARIPKHPYYVRGVFGAKLGCIPVDDELTPLYLQTIQLWSARKWNRSLRSERRVLRLWRDGESPFLLPNGLEREEFWLTSCVAERVHLGEQEYEEPNDQGYYKVYPVHAFSTWMKELRMFGYISRIQEIEKRLSDLPTLAKYLWLLTINSDILSSAEKQSPLITLRGEQSKKQTQKFRILRSERNYEGEEYLALLDRYIKDKKYPVELNDQATPHLQKAKARVDHLNGLGPP